MLSMTAEDAKGLLTSMVKVQAGANTFKHMILEHHSLDEGDKEMFETIFEAINQMIVINMNCMRDIKKILETK